MLKYSITRENGQLFLECLNGGTGSRGRKALGKADGRDAMDLIDKLIGREHVKESNVGYVYQDGQPHAFVRKGHDGGIVWDVRALCVFMRTEDYKPDCLAGLFECTRDVLTLTGFCKVLLDNRPLGKRQRAA